jgi:hypothetical protein
MWYYDGCQMDAKEKYKQCKYTNKYSNILRAQKLKRTNKDSTKIMEREEMCKECQNLRSNLQEKHTT